MRQIVLGFALLALTTSSATFAGQFQLEWEAPAGQALSGFYDLGTVYSRALLNDLWDMEGDGVPEFPLESRTQAYDEEASVYDGQTKLLEWSYDMPGNYGFSPTLAGFVDMDGDGLREALVHLWRVETQEAVLRIIDWQTDVVEAEITGMYAGVADVDVDGLPEALLLVGQPYRLQVWGFGDAGVSGVGEDAALGDLRPAVPNPFSREATVEFSLDVEQTVRARIYDLNGRLVSNLIDTTMEPGRHAIRWDATDQVGQPVSNGVYLMSVETRDGAETRKMVFLR